MRKNISKKFISMLLASSMVVGSTAVLAGCGSKKDEVITLDVYSQLANYSGIQTGWIADILEDKFKVKLNIIPEPVKAKQSPCPDYYKKYRIYKEIKERDGNGEAYLLQEEEDMILSVCRTEEEAELMKHCTYAYQYPANLVIKSFREDKKDRKQ